MTPKRLLGSMVRWCDHRLPHNLKEALSEVRLHTGTVQVDSEVDGQPAADSPRGDHMITMVKETVKRSFEKWKKLKLVHIVHRFKNDETLLTARLPVTVSNVQTGSLAYARTHTATHKPASARALKVPSWHQLIFCGALRLFGLAGQLTA